MTSDGAAIALWDGPAPGSESWTQEERVGPGEWIRNVVVPTTTLYLPDGGADRAVVICPGGALHFVSMASEGVAVAELLRDAGYAAFVVKYRVVPTPPDDDAFARTLADLFHESGIESLMAPVLPFAVADAQRAMEIVRGEGYSQVSLVGFSAGGRIAAEILLRSAAVYRPDAAAIIYLPSLQECVADADAPPLFVCAAADDPLGIGGSLALHDAWRAAGVPVELHLFERGSHGFGMNATGLPVDSWSQLLVAWLDSHKT